MSMLGDLLTTRFWLAVGLALPVAIVFGHALLHSRGGPVARRREQRTRQQHDREAQLDAQRELLRAKMALAMEAQPEPTSTVSRGDVVQRRDPL